MFSERPKHRLPGLQRRAQFIYSDAKLATACSMNLSLNRDRITGPDAAAPESFWLWKVIQSFPLSRNLHQRTPLSRQFGPSSYGSHPLLRIYVLLNRLPLRWRKTWYWCIPSAKVLAPNQVSGFSGLLRIFLPGSGRTATTQFITKYSPSVPYSKSPHDSSVVLSPIFGPSSLLVKITMSMPTMFVSIVGLDWSGSSRC